MQDCLIHNILAHVRVNIPIVLYQYTQLKMWNWIVKLFKGLIRIQPKINFDSKL